MARIDDPLDAAKQQSAEQSNKFNELILELAGLASVPIAIVNTIRKHFSPEAANGRVMYLFDAMETVVRANGKKLEDLEEKISSADFADTLITAVNESLRTTDQKKIERFAAIVGNQ